MGLKEDPHKNLWRYHADIAFDDFEKFYSSEIKDKNMQIVVVGNSSKFDVKILEKYGELIKMKPKQVVRD